MDPFSQLILLISVVSFCTFQWLFHSVSPWASSRISPGFLKLTHKQKIEWNSRTVSTLHALLVGLFCLYILFFDEAVNQDPVWGDPTLVKINVSITTGYLISDLLLIFYYWRAIGDKFFVVHHLAALYAYYYVLGQGMLPYFANFRLLAEFSTPCVNQRWFFEVLGYPKSSKPNMANGVLMAAVFFLVRIAIMPVYYGRMFSVYGTEAFYKVSFGGRSAWIFSSICLDIMNIMWMHKIARGCYKVLRSNRKSKFESQENGKMD
ncbi:TLC domain-containing protein 4-B-like isoform X1 [Xyrauchen texanus]|uniref:TLC domain-containing protein 4-B-like isoform X1 n=1 Tax=Xyrauchen texanus TaxID=154827 RepID=UPI00224207CC|nr:TLC domain-containing protein 4-B-like isoform X1 [Xyrauchen texanus]XP_051970863.1 TLC domain-containing protein 4-B-like isoform X1 [Xyrauchen texanus]